MADDKSEKPSPRKLKELREKGQLPRSQDLLQAATFFGAVAILNYFGSSMMGTLKTGLKQGLMRVGASPLTPLDGGAVSQLALDGLSQLISVCAPLAVVAIISAVAIQVAASRGFVFAPEALAINWGALSPANGIKRLGPSVGGYALLKAVLVSTALVTIGWQTIQPFLTTGVTLGRVGVGPAVSAGWAIAMAMLWKFSIVLILFGVADFGYQFWQFMRTNAGSKQDSKDEAKQQDGSPETKARIRRIQRGMARRRMMADVPKATVVVTNPTHYAMALEYHRGTMPAPRVLAKGKNLIAQRIKAIAREHGVPIVENPPLAQALFKSVEVGDTIPGELFDAVAEVLAYLIRLKQLVL
ncbi:MAG: EscU/YscU/HrcU family type III secretion system export apparatus switch protein [Acidobacteriota bacterium]